MGESFSVLRKGQCLPCGGRTATYWLQLECARTWDEDAIDTPTGALAACGAPATLRRYWTSSGLTHHIFKACDNCIAHCGEAKAWFTHRPDGWLEHRSIWK